MYRQSLWSDKTARINKLNLSDDQKSQLIAFFKKYPHQESRIDWNRKDLEWKDFESLIENEGKSKSQAKKHGLSGITEGVDYNVLEKTDEYTAYQILTYLGSKTIASNAVPPVKGRGAKWCTAYQKTDEYWERYTNRGCQFIYVCTDTTKYALVLNPDRVSYTCFDFNDHEVSVPDKFKHLFSLLPDGLKDPLDLLEKNSDGTYSLPAGVDAKHFVRNGRFTVKFKHAYGNFECNSLRLTSLEGAPSTVDGDFNCSFNQLTSLEGGPSSVGGKYDCDYNHLTSLSGAPSSVGGGFSCYNNHLTSLEGAPSSVGGYFSCSYNKLTSLEGSPSSVGGCFSCDNNQLTSLEGSPSSVKGWFTCTINKLTSLKGGPSSVGDFYDCNYNQLTSLEGAPSSVKGWFNCSDNQLTSLEGLPETIRLYRVRCGNNKVSSVELKNNYLEAHKKSELKSDKTSRINKLNLSDDQKSQLITFFKRYPNQESKIDWNRKDLEWKDFSELLENEGKSKSQAKKRGLSGLVEGKDYDIIEQTDDYIAYHIRTYLGSKTIASNSVPPVKGNGAKWCTAYQKTDEYWDDYHNEGDCEFAYVCTTTTKYALVLIPDRGSFYKQCFSFGDKKIACPDEFEHLYSNLEFYYYEREKEDPVIRYDLIRNEDGSYDIPKGLDNKKIAKFVKDGRFTVRFNHAKGNFDCRKLNLVSLEGSPRTVEGYFDCSGNQLVTLEGGPVSATDYHCSYSQLKSLKGSPTEVEGFFCTDNELTSLINGPLKVKSFYCSKNKLVSLEGAPQKCNWFNCNDNLLTSLEGGPKEVKTYYCANNKLTSFKGAPNESDFFNCSGNMLKTLEGCPKVKELCCYENFITTLVGSPSTIEQLTIDQNELTSLEGCPPHLKLLSCKQNQLTSLVGCPSEVRSLHCSNNQLTSLEGCPSEVTFADFYNNKLTSLKGAPSKVTYSLDLSKNELRSLEGLPESVNLDVVRCTGNKISGAKLKQNYLEWLGENKDLTRFLEKNSDGTYNIKSTHDVDIKLFIRNGRFSVKFKQSYGDFDCSKKGLVSLEGAPEIVDGSFSCAENKLTSLVGGPSTVNGEWYICDYNNLTSLVGSPSHVDGLICSHNQLTSLEGSPEFVDYINCSNNQLTSLKGLSPSSGKMLIEKSNITLTGNPVSPSELKESYLQSLNLSEDVIVEEG